MRRLAVLAGSIGAALLLASAVGHGQGKPTVTLTGNQLFHTVDVPAGLTTFTVTCPPGFAATGGGFVQATRGGRVLSSIPVGGPRTWKFTVGAGPNGDHVTVVVICTRPLKVPTFPGVPVKLKPLVINKAIILKAIKAPAPVVGPGETKKLNLKCPGGYAPDSYGIDQTFGEKKYRAPATPISPNATLRTELVGAMPVPGGYEFTVRNFSTGAPDPGESTTLAVQCSQRTVGFTYRRRRRRRKLLVMPQIVRVTSPTELPPGEFTTLTVRCPAGSIATGYGYDFGMRDAFIFSGYAWGSDGRATMDVYNGEPTPSPIVAFALCMSATATTVP